MLPWRRDSCHSRNSKIDSRKNNSNRRGDSSTRDNWNIMDVNNRDARTDGNIINKEMLTTVGTPATATNKSRDVSNIKNPETLERPSTAETLVSMNNSSSRVWGPSNANDRRKIGKQQSLQQQQRQRKPGSLAIAEMLNVAGTPAKQHWEELCQSRGLSEVGYVCLL